MEIELSFTTDEVRLLRAALTDHEHAIARSMSAIGLIDTPEAEQLRKAHIKRAAAVSALFHKLPVVR